MMVSLSRSTFPLYSCGRWLSRPYASWLKKIFGQKGSGDTERESAQISPMEHLKQLAHMHSPHISTNWISAPLLGQDTDFKTKVLLSCEKQFNISFSDRQLGSIRTPQDVLRLVSQPREPAPQTVFPKIEQMESFPPNLSVYAASTQSSTKKRVRQPFQNYDCPEHAMFLNKQKKEAKKKRRHLTVIEKRYA